MIPPSACPLWQPDTGNPTRSGQPRPTLPHHALGHDQPKVPRGRRRPDPLIDVTGHLERWFKEEPWRTGRELLEKLPSERPGNYPGNLLRTVQRRLKRWRSEQALALVFSGLSGPPVVASAPAAPATIEG